MRITWSPELVDAISRGLPLTVIGQAVLEAPLAGLAVIARGGPTPNAKLSLAAVLQPRSLMKVPEIVGMSVKPKRGGVLVEDAFIVTPGLLNQLVVACGSWPILVPILYSNTASRPISDAAMIKKELELFSSVVVATVDGIYRTADRPSPAVELTLNLTALSIQAALNGLARIRRGAADLASRGQGGRPGRVYQPTPETETEETVTFADVGGQDEAKSQLEAICQAIRDPDSYRRWGVRPPRGILLYGPPGTGKTLLARCLARESGAAFIHVRATDVTSKWYGEGERKLQEAFDWARREAPAVLFFDEIDALGRSREDSHEATHRLVSTFLENMDGLEASEGVVVLAATNRPEAVDDALTRPGRFDRLVEVPVPDRAGRRAIFAVHIRKADRRAGRTVFEPLDDGGWERLLDASEGFSGAEISEAIRRALEARVRAGDIGGQIGQDELLVHAVSVARPW